MSFQGCILIEVYIGLHFYGADVSTDYLTVDYKPPSIVYSISYRTNSIKRKKVALHPQPFPFFGVSVEQHYDSFTRNLRRGFFGKQQKSARESPFSALVVLLCFIGGYLPSRVFGFNNLLVFVLPLYLVFDVSVSLYEYCFIYYSTKFLFFKF